MPDNHIMHLNDCRGYSNLPAVCRVKPGKQTAGHMNPDTQRALTGSTSDLFVRYVTNFSDSHDLHVGNTANWMSYCINGGFLPLEGPHTWEAAYEGAAVILKGEHIGLTTRRGSWRFTTLNTTRWICKGNWRKLLSKWLWYWISAVCSA